MYVSVVLFVKEVVEFKLGGFEKIYKRKLEAEFNFQVERERERERERPISKFIVYKNIDVKIRLFLKFALSPLVELFLQNINFYLKNLLFNQIKQLLYQI